jgi:hypothetical protein
MDVHQMEMRHMDNAGVQEWRCPTCGRQLWMMPQAAGSVEIIEISTGKEYLHEPNRDSLDDSRLAPWLEWLDRREDH